MGCNDRPAPRDMTGLPHNLPFMRNGRWQTLCTSMKTMTELYLQMGLFSRADWGLSGGTWIKPEESMKMLLATEMYVSKGKP